MVSLALPDRALLTSALIDWPQAPLYAHRVAVDGFHRFIVIVALLSGHLLVFYYR